MPAEGEVDMHALSILEYNTHASTISDKQYAMITRLLDMAAHYEGIHVSPSSRRLTTGVQKELRHNPLQRVAPRSSSLSPWQVSGILDCIQKLYAIDHDAWRRMPEFAKVWNDPLVLARRLEWLTYWSRADVSARHASDVQECRDERSRQLKAERLAAMARGRAHARARREAQREAEQRRRTQRTVRAKENKLRRTIGEGAYMCQSAELAMRAANAAAT